MLRILSRRNRRPGERRGEEGNVYRKAAKDTEGGFNGSVRVVNTVQMTNQPPPAEYLVISRGQWDTTLSRSEIQSAIDQFYVWLDRLVDEGKMKRGHRLTYESKTIARNNLISDGPFGESKEVIGGYWFILAHDLEQAAQIAKGNPCIECGLLLEIRPIDPQAATPVNTRGSW
jgi:hypothetical protein